MAYRRASYKGVRFHVLEVSPDMGKRLETHEFPKRDTPYTESFGRSARRWNFRAFMLGPDAAARAQRLCAVCEADGAGLLVLPSEGSVVVENVTIGRVESVDHGRMVMLSLSFVEKGSAPGLIGSIVTSIAVFNAVAAVLSIGRSNYSTSVSSMGAEGQRLASLAVVEHVERLSSAHITAVNPQQHAELRLQLSDLSAALSPAIAAAAALPSIAETLAAAVSTEQAADSTRDIENARVALFANPEAVEPIGEAGPEYQVVLDFVRRIFLLEHAKALASMEFVSRDQADAFRLAISNRFDAEIDIAAVARDGELLAALRPAHAATVRDLVERGRPLPSLRSVRLNATLPALVVAHRLWQDASRSAEAATYAGANHPGFMPQEFTALSA